MKKTVGTGPRIKAWRKKNSITQKELCEILEISQGSLSDIESGNHDPSCQTIINFATETDIGVMWMLTGKSEKMEAAAN